MSRIRAISLLMIIVATCVTMIATSRSVDGDTKTDDAHDSLVYARFDLKVIPGKIKYSDEMKHTELPHPATKEDVANGKAVFTFEGLGKRRVWRLPKCPIGATWVGLKQFPFRWNTGETGYDDNGKVVQAEELLVGGKWKRYFGFSCENGVAVVPADLVDLWLPSDMEPPGTCSGMNLPGGIGWHSLGPYQIREGKRVLNSIAGGRPLFVDAYIINRRGAPMKMPTDLYRDDGNGGPALLEGLEVSVGFAPFKASTAKIYYPCAEDYTPLEPKRRTSFTPTASGRILKTGEWFKVFTIDLSDWFEIKDSGHYIFQFKYDFSAMGLPKEQTWGPSEVLHDFMIGTPPRRLTVEEMNKNIPPFGGLFTEKQLRDLIVKTVKPPQPSLKMHGGKSSKKATSLLPATKLPVFSRAILYEGNGPPNQVAIEKMFSANRKLIATLDDYEQMGLLRELKRRQAAEKDGDMKLLLTSLAAVRGSSDAALLLLNGMKSTDFKETRNIHSAIRQTLYALEEDQPDWIVQLAISALADQRYVTETEYNSSEYLTISYHADESADLTHALGHIKCRKAVPFLIQMCKDTQGARGPVMALGSIGDPRAIPVLMECLRRAGKTVKYIDGCGLPDQFYRPVYALANLKANEAVPELLKHVAFPDVVEALAILGDSRAIGPLKKLVADGGRIVRNGEEIYPSLARSRLIEARITLACLDEKDAVAKLCALLNDKDFGEYQRRTVVWRLGDIQDPRAIPFLIKAIKTDAGGAVVNQAITVLSVFKYKEAVDGLIECFDADFNDKFDWKRAYNPEMFRENIAESLKKITGHNLGPNKQEWLDWWRKNREIVKDVK